MLMRRGAPMPAGGVSVAPVAPGGQQAHVCAGCPVRSEALFGALGDDLLRRIDTPIASPVLQADARILSRGQVPSALYTVRSGLVRFERLSSCGGRHIVRLVGRGGLIGLEGLLRQPCADEVVACTTVQVCRIPLDLADTLDSGRGEMALALMRQWQRALDDSASLSAGLRTGPARLRVLRLLHHLAQHADEAGRLWMPRREEMADLLGMALETASRAVSALRREGVLELLPQRMATVQAEALSLALGRAEGRRTGTGGIR